MNTIISGSVCVITCQVISGPTSPAVPIPDPVALFVIWKTTVPTGPRITLERIARDPDLRMAHDIRYLQHRCTNALGKAAPANLILPEACHRKTDHIAAAADRCRTRRQARQIRITPSAAELIGSVRIMPISTETTIPITSGCCSVPQLIRDPSHAINPEIGGPTRSPTTDRNRCTQAVSE